MLAFLFLHRAQGAQETDRLSSYKQWAEGNSDNPKIFVVWPLRSGCHSLCPDKGPEGHKFVSVTIAAERCIHSAWRSAVEALT